MLDVKQEEYPEENRIDILKAISSVSLISDVIAAVKSGFVRRPHAVRIVPDFDNARTPEHLLRYDVVDPDGNKANSEPLPIHAAEMMLEMMEGARAATAESDALRKS